MARLVEVVGGRVQDGQSRQTSGILAGALLPQQLVRSRNDGVALADNFKSALF